MNTHTRWAAKMMRPEPSSARAVAHKAADRERRRIRRAQREALVLLVRLFDNTENRLLHDVMVKAHGCLDTATRAPRKGKR